MRLRLNCIQRFFTKKTKNKAQTNTMTRALPAKPQFKPTLMGLPRELRDLIISELLTTTDEIPIDLHDTIVSHPYPADKHWFRHCQSYTMPSLHPQILGACSQLQAEGLRLLYPKGNKPKRVLILLQNITRSRGQLTHAVPGHQQRVAGWSVLHNFLVPSHPLDLGPLLLKEAPRFDFLLQSRRLRTNTLKHVTIRHFLPTFKLGTYDPRVEDVMGFLLQYGRDAVRMLTQAETLRVELALSSSLWYFPQFKRLTWYPNGYTFDLTQVPPYVVLNETREHYVDRIEQWVRTSCRFENKSFATIFAEDERLARVLKMIVKQEIVPNAAGRNLYADFAWHEDAFAEGVERACRT